MERIIQYHRTANLCSMWYLKLVLFWEVKRTVTFHTTILPLCSFSPVTIELLSTQCAALSYPYRHTFSSWSPTISPYNGIKELIHSCVQLIAISILSNYNRPYLISSDRLSVWQWINQRKDSNCDLSNPRQYFRQLNCSPETSSSGYYIPETVSAQFSTSCS